MAFEELMEITGRLMTQAEALAAMAARLKLIDMGIDGDPAVRAQLDRVADALGVRALYDDLDAQQRSIIISFTTSYLRQAVDLLEDPGRRGEWAHTDPGILQAQGAASGVIASLIAGAGLGGPGIRILDVGAGVAGLATAFCRTFPGATVVGLDPWEPSLALARANVAAAGMESRITLLPVLVQDFDDAEGFDLVWLPTFFVPDAVLDAALERVRAVTRPGGTVVLGAFQAPADELSARVDDLRTVRSGGAAITAAEAIDRLTRAGFAGVHEVERTWKAPVRLIVGVR